MSENSIVYQNKDVVSKVLAESLLGKSLKTYGINVPKIVQVLPTNLPEVEANELRLDNLFLLEDGSVAIIDYESEFKKFNRNKYINYIARILKRYELNGIYDIKLRLIIIYTGDIKRSNVTSYYDVGAATVTLECAFLSEIDSDKIRYNLTKKIENGEALTDKEIMEFIILPLTYRSPKDKQSSIKNSVELAKKIKDEKVMVSVLSGILAFTDKIIDDELGAKIKEWIMMTKVERLFMQENEAALAQKDAEIAHIRAENATKDAEIAEIKAINAKTIADKDARIKELEAQLKMAEANK